MTNPLNRCTFMKSCDRSNICFYVCLLHFIVYDSVEHDNIMSCNVVTSNVSTPVDDIQ